MEDNSPEGLKRETTAGLLSLLDYFKAKVPAGDLADALEQLVRDYTAHPNSDAVGISALHNTLRGRAPPAHRMAPDRPWPVGTRHP